MDLLENIKDALEGATSELAELAAVCPAVTTTECFPAAVKLLDEATALLQVERRASDMLAGTGLEGVRLEEFTPLDLVRLRIRINRELDKLSKTGG